MRDEQFLSSKHHSMLAVSTDAEALLDRLTSTMHVHVPKPASMRPGTPPNKIGEIEAARSDFIG